MEVINDGKEIFLDEEDLDLYNKYKWSPLQVSKNSKSFYLVRISSKSVKNKRRSLTIYFHREIMKAKLGELIDHKDTNTLNNQKENLRICTYSQNQRNSKLRKDNTSGYKGVSWKKKRNKWVAKISINSKQKHLGYFNDPKLAHDAYCKAAIEYFGDFANLS
jgi:hypothetical protein